MFAMYSQPRTQPKAVVSNPNFPLTRAECHQAVEHWKRMTKWHSLHSSISLVLGFLHVSKATLAMMVHKSEEGVSGMLDLPEVPGQLEEVQQIWIQME